MSITSLAQLAVERRRPDAHLGAAYSWSGTTAAAAASAEAPIDVGANVLARAVPTDIIVFYTAVVGVLEGVEKDNPHSYLPFRWALYGATIAATVIAAAVASRLANRKVDARQHDRLIEGDEDDHEADGRSTPNPQFTGPMPRGEGLPEKVATQRNEQTKQANATATTDTDAGQRRASERATTALNTWWRDWQPPAAETITATFAFAVWGLVLPGSGLYASLHSPALPIAVTAITAGGVLVMNVFFTPLLSKPAPS